MPSMFRDPVGPVLVVAWLTFSGTAVAQKGGVSDGLGFFGEKARDQAERQIEDIRSRTNKDVLIETLAQLPDDLSAEYRKQAPPQVRARAFQEIALTLAERHGLDGVYVLLWKPPNERTADHAVVVWPPENDDLFPRDDRRQLDNFFAWLRPNDPNRDRVLLDAVAFADARLQTNLRALAAAPVRDGFHWTAALWAVAALLTAWGLLGAARWRQGAPAVVSGGEAATLSTVGAAAGFWLFRALFHHEAKETQPASATEVIAPPENPPTPAHGPAAEDTEASPGA